MPDALHHFDDIPDIDCDPDPDFSWVARDGSDQALNLWFTVSTEGVEMCASTLTCGYGRTVITQPIPAEAFSALVRAAQRAETEALVQKGCRR